jgi:arylsulfatase A
MKFLTFVFVSLCVLHSTTASQPNFVIILADDLGYGDVRCYNAVDGKIQTPHIDKLASQGMRFTDSHTSSGVCSPTRYALLTGRYHWRTRLQAGIVPHLGEPLIARDRMTIGSLVKQHGYTTAAIGKWHLGWDWGILPEQMELFAPGRGGQPEVTDVHRAAWKQVFSKPIAGGPTTRGFDEYFGTDVPNQSPYCFIKNDRIVGEPSVFLPASDFLNHRAGLQGPANADWKLEEILPTLRRQAVDFIQRQAAAKRPFLLYMPLTSPHTPIVPTDDWKDKSGMNAFADFVMQTDAVVGDILRTLDESGVAANTFVLFTSDNGCATHAVREMAKHGHNSSGPLRDHKGSVFEGGHRVPFVVRWPETVKAAQVCDQLVHQSDVLATLAEILGSKLPDNAGEDSVSFLSLLKDPTHAVRRHAISTAGSGAPSLRDGPWKLVVNANLAQLYNLADDIAETNNLAAKEKQRVADMRAQLEKYIADGRSTPGTPQKNDVEVIRYPQTKPGKE